MNDKARDPAAKDRHPAYQRRRDLPGLLPLWPHEMQPADLTEHARLLARMRRALRVERQRGLAGLWAYNLARHVQLLRAYRAETADYLSRANAVPRDTPQDG
ncbi:MAG: hypothetical protein WC829_20540 [Hyphomicrobium sp.]|jgi:hypothetical protein